MKLVTGGAGFLGSHVVDGLVARGDNVVVLDDLSGGHRAFLASHLSSRRIDFHKADLFNARLLKKALAGVTEVWHLAADPNVRGGLLEPQRILRQDAEATFVLLEAMRTADVRRLLFTSSSTVYGEATKIPTPEGYGPLLPISVYGAAKLASEAAISSYAATYGLQAWIFRLGNVVGPRLTHGVIYDFHRALDHNEQELTILGDGRQEKSYLSAEDGVRAMLHARDFSNASVNLFNLASKDRTNVRRIAELVCAARGLRNVRFHFTGGPRGWPGDVPRMGLRIERLERIGWKPKHSSEEAVRIAARTLAPAPTPPPAKVK